MAIADADRTEPSAPGRPRRRGTALAALAAALVLVASGCLGKPSLGHVPPGSKLVQIYHMAFRPRVVHVEAGHSVTWRFEDQDVLHDVDAIGGSFESPQKDSGTWTHVFSKPGVYDYRCSIHTYMTGEVVVTARPAGTGG